MTDVELLINLLKDDYDCCQHQHRGKRSIATLNINQFCSRIKKVTSCARLKCRFFVKRWGNQSAISMVRPYATKRDIRMSCLRVSSIFPFLPSKKHLWHVAAFLVQSEEKVFVETYGYLVPSSNRLVNAY